MGLARHESYDLAKVANFDVNYYREKRYEWLKNGVREKQVNNQILLELKSGDYKVGREGFRNSFEIKGNIKTHERDYDYKESKLEGVATSKMSSLPRNEEYLQNNNHIQTDEIEIPPPPPRIINWNYENEMDMLRYDSQVQPASLRSSQLSLDRYSTDKRRVLSSPLREEDIAEYVTKPETDLNDIESYHLTPSVSRDFISRDQPTKKSFDHLRDSSSYSSSNTVATMHERAELLRSIKNSTNMHLKPISSPDVCKNLALRADDLDHRSFEMATSKNDNDLLMSSNTLPTKRERLKRSKEGLKALSEYKAAIRIQYRLDLKSNLSKEDKERLQWAKETIEQGRAHFELRHKYAAKNPVFANCIEECVIKSLTEKQQNSIDKCSNTAYAKDSRKRNQYPEEMKPTTSKAAAETLPKVAKVSERAKRHLSVALVDMSNPLGQMTTEQWELVESKIFNATVVKMEAEPSRPMPSFDGAGWFNGVKLLNCKDDTTLAWIKNLVPKLKGLWKNAQLKIVERSNIPSMPIAKVMIPGIVEPDIALRLLQRQNPDIPTSDWKILHVDKANKEGQNYILQITNEAADLLYMRKGKMFWGMRCVYLKLKKRNPEDTNLNTVEFEKV